jgi:hypothetical protein
MALRKKLACCLPGGSATPCRRTLGGKRRLGGRPCQGRQPPEAGAVGPPLQGLPPSHTRPPRSRADRHDPTFSANYARIHAAGNNRSSRARFFNCWLRTDTNRARHPLGSSFGPTGACALAAWPPQKNVGTVPHPIELHSAMVAGMPAPISGWLTVRAIRCRDCW